MNKGINSLTFIYWNYNFISLWAPNTVFHPREKLKLFLSSINLSFHHIFYWNLKTNWNISGLTRQKCLNPLGQPQYRSWIELWGQSRKKFVFFDSLQHCQNAVLIFGIYSHLHFWYKLQHFWYKLPHFWYSHPHSWDRGGSCEYLSQWSL